MDRRRALLLLALTAAAALVLVWRPSPAPAAAPTAAPAARPAPAASLRTATLEKEGLALSFQLRPSPGGAAEATARLTVTDARSGEPLTGLHPLGWLARREPGAGAPDEAACKRKVRESMAGLLSVQADVDLNAFLLLTLNHDHTLSVINPQVAFSRTKLRNLVSLPGAAADWALHPAQRALYVSIPAVGRVSVVDTQRFLATGAVTVGKRPTRLALAPGGRSLWVSNEGDGTVSVLDTATHAVRKTLRVGSGRHAFAFTHAGRRAWVASSGAAHVEVFDTSDLRSLARLPVGPGASTLAASEAAGAVYVTGGGSGEVTVLDAERLAVSSRLPLAPGTSLLSADPTGRWVLALNAGRGTLDVLDTSTAQVAHHLTGFSSPDAVTFTAANAYVRNAGASWVGLIARQALGSAAPPPVARVQMTQRPATEAREQGMSAPLVPLPDGRGVIVAGPADKALYFYTEGMMAPAGTHANYGREPRALLLLDRSLREVEPGTYETTVPVSTRGLHDVALLLDAPRMAACLAWDVAAPGAAAAEPSLSSLQLTPAFDPKQLLRAQQPTTLRFRPTDAANPEPIAAEEMTVLIFRRPGTWQVRLTPRALGEGLFAVDFLPPTPGQYQFLVGMAGRGAPMGSLPPLALGVVP